MAGCGYTGRHFGASYDDAVCCDGTLWDLDSCDEPGGPLHHGGDVPCPSCSTTQYILGALEDAQAGGWGCDMGRYWSAASLWRGAVRCAISANPNAAEAMIKKIGPVETEDFLHPPSDPRFIPGVMVPVTVMVPITVPLPAAPANQAEVAE